LPAKSSASLESKTSEELKPAKFQLVDTLPAPVVADLESKPRKKSAKISKVQKHAVAPKETQISSVAAERPRPKADTASMPIEKLIAVENRSIPAGPSHRN